MRLEQTGAAVGPNVAATADSATKTPYGLLSVIARAKGWAGQCSAPWDNSRARSRTTTAEQPVPARQARDDLQPGALPFLGAEKPRPNVFTRLRSKLSGMFESPSADAAAPQPPESALGRTGTHSHIDKHGDRISRTLRVEGDTNRLEVTRHLISGSVQYVSETQAGDHHPRSPATQELNFPDGTTFSRTADASARTYRIVKNGAVVWQRIEEVTDELPSPAVPRKGESWPAERLIDHLFHDAPPAGPAAFHNPIIETPVDARFAGVVPAGGSWKKDGTTFVIKFPNTAKWITNLSGEPGLQSDPPPADQKPGWMRRLLGHAVGAAHAEMYADRHRPADPAKAVDEPGQRWVMVSPTGKRRHELIISPDGEHKTLILQRKHEVTEQSSEMRVESVAGVVTHTLTMTRPGADTRTDQKVEFRIMEVPARDGHRPYTTYAIRGWVPPVRPGGLPQERVLFSSDSYSDNGLTVKAAMHEMTRRPGSWPGGADPASMWPTDGAAFAKCVLGDAFTHLMPRMMVASHENQTIAAKLANSKFRKGDITSVTLIRGTGTRGTDNVTIPAQGLIDYLYPDDFGGGEPSPAPTGPRSTAGSMVSA